MVRCPEKETLEGEAGGEDLRGDRCDVGDDTEEEE